MDALQGLAEIVLVACPAGYRQAHLAAELDKDFAQIDLRCMNDLGEEVISELPGLTGPDLHDKLDEIREEMARLSGARWTKCEFKVFPDGKFKFDVHYD